MRVEIPMSRCGYILAAITDSIDFLKKMAKINEKKENRRADQFLG